MIRTIIIGDKEFTLEANLGTAYLYRQFTGTDLMTKFVALSKAKDQPGDMGVVALSFAQELCYIMQLQYEKKNNIAEISPELTPEKYYTWLCNFAPSDFKVVQVAQILEFWKAQSKEQTESKN